MKVKKIPAKKPSSFKRKKVAAYTRVSTASEAQLHSLGAQIDYYKKHIMSRPDWEFAGVFIDDGITGTKSKRPGLEELLSTCDAGKIDLILTKSISRFARNTLDLLNIVRDLKEQGIAVYFERERINTLTAEGELLLTLLASFAQEEAISASKNKSWSIKKQFENGELVGMSHLYGYDVIDGNLIINEHEAQIVRMVYEDYLSGLQSGNIAKKLNDMGEPRKQGGKWKASDIRSLLKNEKHTGNALLNKRYTIDPLTKETKYNYGERPQYFVQNSHEGIISWELFEAVKEEMRRRAPIKKALPHHGKPFTGLLFCGACGAPFNRKKTPVRVFWRCARNLGMRDGKCDMKGIPEQVLEDMLCELLGTNDLSHENITAKIEEMTITQPNEIVFFMKDGTEVKRTWKDRSRSESWTKEMREKVAEQNRKRARHE